jgi:hypothetical protein
MNSHDGHCPQFYLCQLLSFCQAGIKSNYVFTKFNKNWFQIQTKDKYLQDLKENKLFSHSDKNRKMDEIDIV